MQQGDLPVVAAAVIVRGGRVLLIQRAVAEGDLLWQFPAGEVEVGESGADAAVREVLEETGLVVEVSELLGERVHPLSGRLMRYFACGVVSGVAGIADPEEVAAVAWVLPGQLPALVPRGFFGPVQSYLDGALS